MERYIKFRGLRKDDGKWAYGDLASLKYPVLPYEAPMIMDQDGAWEVDIETVGQFTGLADKNGKEIYESDIVELPLQSGERIKVICRFGTVQRKMDTGWMCDITGFYFQRSDGLNSFPIVKNYAGKHDLELFEVVGNIYEHPELLVTN